MKKASTKACEISPAVKRAVAERDGGMCVICRRNVGLPEGHYIPRSKLGMGIPENIVCICRECHDKQHARGYGELVRRRMKEYLDEKYPGFPDDDRVYHKYPEELRL